MAKDNSPYSQADIDALVEAYAAFHEVKPSAVDVCRNYEGDSNVVIGVRLSLDVEGVSRGCDEQFGEW